MTTLNDGEALAPPSVLTAIQRDTRAIGFTMASDERTGNLLRALVATKPGGMFLELGTGTGLATAWMLDGMDSHARLQTVDSDVRAMAVAKRHLGHDPRLSCHVGDGIAFLAERKPAQYDLVFADTWPGKYDGLDLALRLVKPGGMYVVDDMLPQPNWPDDHPPKVERLLATLAHLTEFHVVKMAWSSGHVLLVRKVA